MTTIISLENISLTRNKVKILHPMSWTFNKGEHWAILGLNGSGKTSILNLVSGYLFPSTGTVTVLGNEYGKVNLHELRKKIGFVSTSLDRFSQLVNRDTVERVVVSGKYASFGLYEKVPEEEFTEAKTLLKQLRLHYLIGKKFHLLSQGEQRRVLIARALINDPSILILDEPCSGLDILSREEVIQMIESISDTCHIIYVTHHLDELVETISHALLLKDGQIVASGKKEEVLTEQLLTDTYAIPVNIEWHNKRPHLSLK